MTRMLSLLILVVGCLTGCTRRPQHNSNCEWPQETDAGALDLSQPAAPRHLSDDAEFAEDLAIRYADARRGMRSGHFEGMAEYSRTRDQCMAALFRVIGSSHGVTEEQVRRSLGSRRTGLDLAVMLSFAVLYGWAANAIARRICRTHEQGSLAWVGVTIYASAAASAAGVFLGELWSLMMETYRLSSGHLSYRPLEPAPHGLVCWRRHSVLAGGRSPLSGRRPWYGLRVRQLQSITLTE